MRQLKIVLFFVFVILKITVAAYEPEILIFKTKEELGEACAQHIIQKISDNNSEGKKTVLGLATGSTPVPTYQAFRRIVKQNNIDLSHVITFNLDEYIGIPQDHSQSYHTFMFSNLFEDLMESNDFPNGFRLENIHIPSGYAKAFKDLDLEEIAALLLHFPQRGKSLKLSEEEELWILQKRANKYDDLIASIGPIDLQILGIGTNGHIGFAEPGSSFSSITGIVSLTENTRVDNARFFDGDLEAVPKMAISMGIGTILRAKEIFLLATGKNKAAIIFETLHSSISEEIPSTSLRLHSDVTFYLDSEARK